MFGDVKRMARLSAFDVRPWRNIENRYLCLYWTTQQLIKTMNVFLILKRGVCKNPCQGASYYPSWVQAESHAEMKLPRQGMISLAEARHDGWVCWKIPSQIRAWSSSELLAVLYLNIRVLISIRVWIPYWRSPCKKQSIRRNAVWLSINNGCMCDGISRSWSRCE